jgi:branched-chain amino acid transport system permease protein
MVVLTQILIDWAHLSLLSLAIGFLLFESGVLTLGHAGALLAGAYCVAFLGLGEFGWLPILCLLVAVLGGLALSALRVRGDIFAVTSLALSEALRYTSLGAYELTKGALGLGPIPATWLRSDGGAVTAGLIAVACVAVVYFLLIRGWPGIILGAIRDNELVARGAGFATLSTRFAVVSLSGLVAAISGGLQVAYFGSAYPNMGRLEVSLMAFAAVMLASPVWRQGRAGRSVCGILAGTAVIVALPPGLRRLLPGSVDVAILRQILFGSLLYLLVHPSKPLSRLGYWLSAKIKPRVHWQRGSVL